MSAPNRDSLNRKLSASDASSGRNDSCILEVEDLNNNTLNNQTNVDVNEMYVPMGGNMERPMGRTKAKKIASNERIQKSSQKREQGDMTTVMERLVKETGTIASQHGAISDQLKRRQDFAESMALRQQKMELAKYFYEMKNVEKAQEIMLSIEQEISLSSASFAATGNSQLSSPSVSFTTSETVTGTKVVPFPSLSPEKVSLVSASSDGSTHTDLKSIGTVSVPDESLVPTVVMEEITKSRVTGNIESV